MKVIKLRSARSECDLLMFLISISNFALSEREKAHFAKTLHVTNYFQPSGF